VRWFHSFVCDTSYEFTSTFLHCFLYDMCEYDFGDMCALHFDLFYVMSLAYAHLLCFRVYSNSNELYFLYLCLFHSYEYMSFGLEHISNPSPFVLIAIAYVNQAC
jgi:hypothetical protein